MDARDERELRRVFEKVDFYYLLNEDIFKKIIPKFYPVSFLPGEKVIQRGASAGAFLILARGKIDVFVKDENGNDIKVRTLGSGNYVGEMALLSGETRNATIIARNVVKAFILGKLAFGNLLEEIPTIRDFFMDVAEKRRRDSEKKTDKSKRGIS